MKLIEFTVVVFELNIISDIYICITPFQFYSDYFFNAPQDAIVKTLVRNRVDTYMYVQVSKL